MIAFTDDSIRTSQSVLKLFSKLFVSGQTIAANCQAQKGLKEVLS